MSLTQQRIVQYLEKHPPASAGEMGAAFGMTAANIRHHLALMIEGGTLEVIRKTPSGRGRPIYLYRLSLESQADNLDGLAHILLTEFLAPAPRDDPPDPLRRLAARLLDLLKAGSPLPQTRSNLTLRLSNAVKVLNTWHYQARWEAHANGPHLMLAHCPYAAILPNHPELCQMDALLLEGLLGTAVKQTASQGLGAPACLFHIGKPNAG
jgi:predicted ArsR family transcriptional regulator